MARIAKGCKKAGRWPEERMVAEITLPEADRRRRRLAMTDDNGQDFLLDLAQTTRLDDGDGLELEDGGFIRVRAAPEEVMEFSCEDGTMLARAMWAIGNRHAAVQILPSHPLPTIRLPWDHVLAGMLEGMGVTGVRRAAAPFHPDAGAYAGAHGHGHGHERPQHSHHD